MRRKPSVLMCLLTLYMSGCSLLLDKDFSDEERAKFKQYPTLGKQIDVNNQVKVTYFGTSTLLISDNSTKLLIDGYFTRPTMGKLFFGVKPNEDVIRRVIEKHDLDDLSVVIPVHSHHDHAMDSPLIAKLTSAKLLGTQSTYNIGINLGLKREKWQLAQSYRSYVYGDFKVTLLPTSHGNIPDFLTNILGIGNEIIEPIQYPATLSCYKESVPFSVLVTHKNAALLVHASTGFKADTLNEVNADWIFLGIAGLSKLSEDAQRAYIDHTIGASGATRVVPIHWDDIMRSSEDRLYPPKRLMGNFGRDLSVLEHIKSEFQESFTLHLLQKEEVIYLDREVID